MEYDVQAIKVSENMMHARQDKYESKAVTRALIKGYPYIRVLLLKLTLNILKRSWSGMQNTKIWIFTPPPPKLKL